MPGTGLVHAGVWLLSQSPLFSFFLSVSHAALNEQHIVLLHYFFFETARLRRTQFFRSSPAWIADPDFAMPPVSCHSSFLCRYRIGQLPLEVRDSATSLHWQWWNAPVIFSAWIQQKSTLRMGTLDWLQPIFIHSLQFTVQSCAFFPSEISPVVSFYSQKVVSSSWAFHEQKGEDRWFLVIFPFFLQLPTLFQRIKSSSGEKREPTKPLSSNSTHCIQETSMSEGS